VLSVGLFADGTANYGGAWNGVTGGVHGLFYGDPSQLLAQVIGAGTCFVYVWGLSYIFFRIVDRILGMRVTPAVELAGVDIPEMGMIPYPEDWGSPETEAPVPPMAPAYP
jgi:Amt family ammonium transporter